MNERNHGLLISVVVPVYGTEEYFTRCMDSLLEQTYPDLEILVVNDGSKGDIRERIKKYTIRMPGPVRLSAFSTFQRMRVFSVPESWVHGKHRESLSHLWTAMIMYHQIFTGSFFRGLSRHLRTS